MIPQSRHIHNLLPVLFTSFFLPSSSSEYAWVYTFFAGMVECWLFFLLLSHGIVSTDLVDTSMVVKRRFSSEVAVKFSRKDPYIFHLQTSAWLTLSVKLATQTLDQNPIFIIPALVRTLLSHRLQARAANGQF